MCNADVLFAVFNAILASSRNISVSHSEGISGLTLMVKWQIAMPG
jgi:hypothetical protein